MSNCASLKYDAHQIQEAIQKIAHDLNSTLDLKKDKFVAVCVLEGAMFFFADLTRCLPADLEIRSIQVSRFHGGTQGGEIQWVKKPDFSLQGRNVLLIDEMCDEGVSLVFVKEEFIRMGANEVYTVALVNKVIERKDNMQPDFYGISYDGQDFLGGYGLDLNRGARHTNAIWTVPREEADIVPDGFFDTQSPFFQLPSKL